MVYKIILIMFALSFIGLAGVFGLRGIRFLNHALSRGSDVPRWVALTYGPFSISVSIVGVLSTCLMLYDSFVRHTVSLYVVAAMTFALSVIMAFTTIKPLGVHKHKCSLCGYVWQHHLNAEDETHNCKRCGTEQLWVYGGNDPVTRCC